MNYQAYNKKTDNSSKKTTLNKVKKLELYNIIQIENWIIKN